MNYYQHHIGDFIRDTSSLPDRLALGYLRMLWLYYESEKPLPDDTEVLGLRVGLEPAEVHLLLRAFFTKEEGVWRQRRCDREIEGYRAISKRNRINGGGGGRPRKNPTETQSVSSGIPEATEQQPSGNPTGTLTNNQEPITNNQINTNTPAAPVPRKRGIDRPSDVSEETWDGFIAIRKAKKSPLSVAALDGIRREATKAGMTLDAALSECCARGWQGFKAEWVKTATANGIPLKPPTPAEARMYEMSPGICAPHIKAWFAQQREVIDVTAFESH